MSANRPRCSSEGSPHGATFQTIVMRGWPTRSCITCRFVPTIGWTHALGRVIGGPEGMSPKYFSTLALTSLATTSPQITSTALAAP
jgi:hypothetical protein